MEVYVVVSEDGDTSVIGTRDLLRRHLTDLRHAWGDLSWSVDTVLRELDRVGRSNFCGEQVYRRTIAGLHSLSLTAWSEGERAVGIWPWADRVTLLTEGAVPSSAEDDDLREALRRFIAEWWDVPVRQVSTDAELDAQARAEREAEEQLDQAEDSYIRDERD